MSYFKSQINHLYWLCFVFSSNPTEVTLGAEYTEYVMLSLGGGNKGWWDRNEPCLLREVGSACAQLCSALLETEVHQGCVVLRSCSPCPTMAGIWLPQSCEGEILWAVGQCSEVQFLETAWSRENIMKKALTLDLVQTSASSDPTTVDGLGWTNFMAP